MVAKRQRGPAPLEFLRRGVASQKMIRDGLRRNTLKRSTVSLAKDSPSLAFESRLQGECNSPVDLLG